MDALASVDELEAGLEFTLSDDERRLAASTLEDLSDDARSLGSATWLGPHNTPLPVRRLVLRAARRFMRNPDGFTQSRAGDETVVWSDHRERSGTAYFTDDEQATLRSFSGRSAIHTVSVFAWNDGPATPEGFVPAEGGKPFPYYTSNGSPW